MTSLLACGDTTTGAGSGPDPETFTPGGTLYVANAGDGRLLAFDAPIDNQKSGSQKSAQSKIIPIVAEGNISPSRQFPDTVSGPTGMFLDRANDVLYVANSDQNTIQIYENASTLSAPLAATRVIAGDQTLLNRPYDVSYDSVEQRLYVVNRDGNSIVAFDLDCLSTTSLSGNISPCRLIVGTDTELDFPRSLTVDIAKNRLYVSNTGNDAILAFAPASEAGGDPGLCLSSFTACNDKPEFLLFPHEKVDAFGIPEQLDKKLEFPFGIHVDSTKDRLYVANTGLNAPGILIYESVSTLFSILSDEEKAASDSNRLFSAPERVLSGLGTQLTVPSGLDLDPANGNLVVVNNNSPNNVNSSTGTNDDSPSLLVFESLDSTCPVPSSEACNIAPSRRIGGDVSADVGTTLASPVGIAYDSERDDTFYVANTGANNILIFSTVLEGDVSPLKTFSGSDTLLNVPSAFFYDRDLDRLYVANKEIAGTLGNNIVVYDQFSSQTEGDTAPSWGIVGDTNLDQPRGLHIDKTRNRMYVLNARTSAATHGLIGYDLSDPYRDAGATMLPADNIDFPTYAATGPSSFLTIQGSRESKTTDGLFQGTSTSMAVREVLSASDGRGEIYVANNRDGVNTVVVYALPDEDSPGSGTYSFSGALTKLRTIDGLNKPSGIFLDTQRDILYVTNNGEESGATADYSADTIFVYENAKTQGNGIAADGSTVVACSTSPCEPTRIISTSGLAAGANNKLKAPISPYIDMENDRLLILNAGSDQNAIFTFQEASTLGDAACVVVSAGGSCSDTLPTRVLSGSDTTLSFSTESAKDFVGALMVTGAANSPKVHVGQSSEPGCESSCTDGSLLVFGIEGKTIPSKIWSAGGGGFSAPGAMALDSSKDLLYVVNQGDNSLSRLTNVSQVNVTVSSSSVKSNFISLGLNKPAGLAIDPTNDRLYISNSESDSCSNPCDSILVFNSASALVDSRVPTATISTGLSGPEGVALDSAATRLYVANTKMDAVSVFNLEKNNELDRILSGTNTKISHPVAVAVDSAQDLLYVLNQRRGEILVFEKASTLEGDVAPSRVIFPAAFGTVSEITSDLSLTLSVPYEGESQSRLPYGLDADLASLQGHVSVVEGSAFISGDGTTFVSDLKVGDVIRFGRAELSHPSDLFLDEGLDVLYLADRGSHTIYIFPEASLAGGSASHKKLKEDLTLLSSPSALTVNTSP